ncbi:MAG TPA: ABC transporter permease [Blastocatellia bacterium]|jgi:putative ABC transport system permease protein|nr:ABC transporter permease [Blastocatellia bacterium]
MRFLEGVKIALASLRAHKLRTFLTLLGVIFGVMTVVAVAAVIEGFFRYIDRTVTADLGANTVILDKFGLITSFEEFINANRRNKDLTLADAEYLRERMTLAQSIGVQGGNAAEIRSLHGKMTNVSVRGVTPNMVNIESTQPEFGRYINETDNEHRRSAALIGAEVADKLFGAREVVGREFKINGLPFEIVGVAKEQGTFFGNSRDAFVIIPLSTHQKMFGSRQSLTISIKAYDWAKLDDVQDQVRMLMRARHRLAYNDKDTFGVFTSDAINNFIHAIFGMIAAVALGVVSISMVVGGIVIMNIMLVTVTERTREIGIRKSLGARRKDILAQFLVESTTLSLIGGLIGLGIAYGISILLVKFTPIPAELPIWAAVMAIGVSSGVGLVFGIYPAWKAAKLDPIVALRAE